MSNRLIRYRAVSMKVAGKVRWLVDQVVIREVVRGKKVVAWDLYFQKTRKAFEGQDPARWAPLLSRTPKKAALREIHLLQSEYKEAVDDAMECFEAITDLSKVVD